jgi:hypothetical protein
MSTDYVPAKIRAGTTLDLLIDLSPDYPAPTWVLTLYLRRPGADVIALVASASGALHAITVAAAVTADYHPGRWTFVGMVAAAGVVHEVLRGQTEVLPSFADSAHDPRTFAETMRDACEKLVAGRALDAHESYTVRDTSVTKSTRGELMGELQRWKRIVAQESGIDTSRAVVTCE